MVCRHHLQSISDNIFRILVEYVTIQYVRLCWRSKWKCMCDAHTLAHSVKCSKLIGFFFLFCAIQIWMLSFNEKNWNWRLIAGATNHPISQYSTKILHILSNPIFYSVYTRITWFGILHYFVQYLSFSVVRVSNLLFVCRYWALQ